MSKLFIEDTTLTAIGDAIRSKTGSTKLISPTDMPTAIGNISGGGGGLTEWSTNTEYSATYASPATANNNYNMFLDGKSFTINTSHSLCGLFYYSNELVDLSKVVINYGGKKNQPYFDGIFAVCHKLEQLPTLRIAEDAEYLNTCYRYNNLFSDCHNLRYIDDDFWQTLWSMKTTSVYSFYLANMFDDCWSLRQLPDMTVIDDIQTSQTTTTRSLYSQIFNNCFALDTIEYLPVLNTTNTMTKNMFSYTFSNCKRIKDIIFATDNGTPYVRNWSKQTIDLTGYVGYSDNRMDMTSTNSGITADKEVVDDATYQALKEDPDWFSLDIAYSRYNHDSAVRTINSLPDCSTGSSNTIKFLGASGSATDGGAINTLTEEEIAVATAKGWTVEIV